MRILRRRSRLGRRANGGIPWGGIWYLYPTSVMSFSQIPICFWVRSIPNHLIRFALASRDLSFRTNMSPSPVVSCLIAWKENIVNSDRFPTYCPAYLDPRECAASSIITAPQLSAVSLIYFISHGSPPKCTTTIALVRSLTLERRSSTFTLNVCRSMSTNTRVQPIYKSRMFVAVHVNRATMTSSLGFIFARRYAMQSASVPDPVIK